MRLRINHRTLWQPPHLPLILKSLVIIAFSYMPTVALGALVHSHVLPSVSAYTCFRSFGFIPAVDVFPVALR